MAGHSHWAGIKHKKAATDAKKGRVWSRLAKAIIVAARMGGGKPEANPRLRLAIADARAVSMPKENIERAIRRGTGEGSATQLEEIIYEGYGPGGVAVLCEVLTDNRNRTAPEVRKIFEVSGGKLGSTGCVAWMFDRKGVFVISANQTDEEKLLELALELGADDVQDLDGESFEVTCSPDMFVAVAEGLEAAKLQPESSQITRIPKETATVTDVEIARRVLRIMEQLEDHDDVQTAATNFDIPSEIADQLD